MLELLVFFFGEVSCSASKRVSESRAQKSKLDENVSMHMVVGPNWGNLGFSQQK